MRLKRKYLTEMKLNRKPFQRLQQEIQSSKQALLANSSLAIYASDKYVSEFHQRTL